MKDYLKLNNISLTYHTKEGETLALDNLSFSANKQEYLSIVGPSGCGKTTILSLISGLLKQSKGEVLLDGEKIGKNVDIGYMFQRDQLFEWRTIYKNVILGLELKKKTKDEKCIKRVDYLLRQYGLKEPKCLRTIRSRLRLTQ